MVKTRVKNFGSKKVWRKSCFARFGKKTNVAIANQRFSNSKTKPNEAIPSYSFARVARPLLAHAGRYRL